MLKYNLSSKLFISFGCYGPLFGSKRNYRWGKKDINWMCNHGKTESPWITAINVVSSEGLQRILPRPKEAEKKILRGAARSSQEDLPLSPFKNKFIFQGGTLYGVFVYEKRRELGDKSEIRGFAIEGDVGGGTRIQSQRQGIAVIRHSTSPFVSYRCNRLSLTITYLIWIRSLRLPVWRWG